MAAQTNLSSRFVRRTHLSANEYHKNFRKVDREIMAAVTSDEADRVTTLMSKIYLRLINASDEFWERDGVLRFEAECRRGKQIKAWNMLCEALGVASATARKALKWMHEQGIIGYCAGKNGVGIRIFLNRARASIGVRASSTGQKILRFPQASNGASPASPNEAASNDSFAVLEVSDSDLNPRAPENGADTEPVDKTDSDPPPPPAPQPPQQSPQPSQSQGREVEAKARRRDTVSVEEVVARLKSELEPCLRAAAMQAAAQTASREIARTREWFETKALPKAVRVAQHETYDLLRKHGTFDEQMRRTRAALELGRTPSDAGTRPIVHRLSPAEIRELAETCVALLEAQGKSFDVTLSEISSEGGGWLLPEDAPRVREAALSLLDRRSESG